jgi:hypothetical protein
MLPLQNTYIPHDHTSSSSTYSIITCEHDSVTKASPAEGFPCIGNNADKPHWPKNIDNCNNERS